MDKLKTIVDREPISSESIAERQDFTEVLGRYKNQNKLGSTNKWLYGSIIGSAVVAGVVISTSLNWDSSIAKEQRAMNNPDKKDVVGIIAKRTTENPVKLAIVNDVKTEVATPAEKTRISKIPSRSSVKNQPAEVVEQAPEESTEQVTEIIDTQEKREQKIPKENNMPHIGSYYFGEVPVNLLCNNEKISSGNNLAVVSYTISYFNGNQEIEEKIRGAKIPDNVCEKLGKFNIGVDVRITSIVAEDRFSGVQYQLPSMSITPVLSE